jgi:transposase
MESRCVVGVDVSKSTLDVARLEEGCVRKIEYTERAVRKWLKTLPAGALIGVESTGTLHRLIVRCAIAAGHIVYVLNARDLSHYARALGRRAKTDRLDAQLIARYVANEHRNLHPHRLPTQLQTHLDELIARRHQVIVHQGALRQSFSSMTKKPTQLTRALRALDELIEQIDEQLARLIAQDERLAPLAQRLHGVVGFGPLLSTTMAHALTRHPFKNCDAFIAYVGLDPRARDSGQLRGRRFLSKRGPAEMRRLLFTAAMSAARTTLWRPFYQRYRDRGIPTTAALVILARKLARIAFSILRHGTAFNPQLVRIPCVRP